MSSKLKDVVTFLKITICFLLSQPVVLMKELIYRFSQAYNRSSRVIYSYNKLTWLMPAIQSKPITWSAVNFKNTAGLDELLN